MKELAFVFPGQGSQKVGMGLDLAQVHSTASETFKEADSVLRRKLSCLCFEGPDEELKQTQNAQLAILTCNVAALRVLQERGISPTVVAGHSLGEYAALVAAEVFSFRDALELVQFRAQFMAEASKMKPGTMAVVLGLEQDILQDLCNDALSDGIIQIANFNCPGQLIVSGEIAPVERVMKSAKVAGAKRCLPLRVSGAFHSPLMTPARNRLRDIIDRFSLKTPKVKFVANVTGDFARTSHQIRELLIEQVTSPVEWEKSIQTIDATGISHFVEAGPGQVLCGLIRRILPEATCFNVEDVNSFDKTTALLSEI